MSILLQFFAILFSLTNQGTWERMMRLKKRIKHLCLGAGAFYTLLLTQGLSANTSLGFHDVTSTVMMNSLEPLPKNKSKTK